MRDLFSRSFLVPAIILAEVAVPFSVLLARTVYWEAHHPGVTVTVSVIMAFVLVMYVVIEGMRQASLLSGALAGLWAAIVATWPSFIVERAMRNAMEMGWSGSHPWVGLLDMVPNMLEFAGIGLALGLLISLIPWLVHRHDARPAIEDSGPKPTGWLLIVTIVFAVVPLLAALGVVRRVDWLMQLYSAGARWDSAARTLFDIEMISRLAVLICAAVATWLFFMRRPLVRTLTTVLLALIVVAALIRLGTSSHIPLSATAGQRQFQSLLDVVDVVAAMLAAGLGIPYILRSRQLRAYAGLSEAMPE